MLVVLQLQEVKVSVVPRLSLAPATVRASIIVPRHPDNRLLIIVLADELEISRSEIPLNGDNEQPQFIRLFTHLPPGSYRVTAVLIRGDKDFRSFADFEVGGGS